MVDDRLALRSGNIQLVHRLVQCVRHGALAIVVGFAWLADPARADAQVVNPSALEFNASVDHDATDPYGTPLVSRYDLEVFQTGGTDAVFVQSIGKPAPDPSRIIRQPLTGLSLPANVSYEARVVATGPYGSSPSARSATFTFQGAVPGPAPAPCTYPLSPSAQSVPAAGGTAQFAVNAAGGCAWSATSSAVWLRITSGSSGSGSGYVNVTADPNSATTSRTATITVQGQTVTVTQAAVSTGGSCTTTVTPGSVSLPAGASSGSLAVMSGSGCTWSASSSAGWLTITSSTGGGTGWVNYSATANGSSSVRTGTITVAGQPIVFAQAGNGGSCSISVTPTSLSVSASPMSSSLSVTAPAGCSWSASSAESWITITSTTGSGPGWVGFGLAQNAGSARTGRITVGGVAVNITQSGVSTTCQAGVTPTVVNLSGSAASDSVAVTAPAGCGWSASSPVAWLSITTTTGSGAGWASFRADANPSSSARSAAVTIAGQSVTFTQAGRGSACATTVGSTAVQVGSALTTTSIAVTAPHNCTWTGASGVSWITVTGATGIGSGGVSVTVADNPSGSSRTGQLTVDGRTVWVTQDARGDRCSVSVTPASHAIESGSAGGFFEVTAAPDCAWESRTNASWLTIIEGGSGIGTGRIAFRPSGAPGTRRTATIVINDKTLTVTQSPTGVMKAPAGVRVVSRP